MSVRDTHTCLIRRQNREGLVKKCRVSLPCNRCSVGVAYVLRVCASNPMCRRLSCTLQRNKHSSRCNIGPPNSQVIFNLCMNHFRVTLGRRVVKNKQEQPGPNPASGKSYQCPGCLQLCGSCLSTLLQVGVDSCQDIDTISTST